MGENHSAKDIKKESEDGGDGTAETLGKILRVRTVKLNSGLRSFAVIGLYIQWNSQITSSLITRTLM